MFTNNLVLLNNNKKDIMQQTVFFSKQYIHIAYVLLLDLFSVSVNLPIAFRILIKLLEKLPVFDISDWLLIVVLSFAVYFMQFNCKKKLEATSGPFHWRKTLKTLTICWFSQTITIYFSFLQFARRVLKWITLYTTY